MSEVCGRGFGLEAPSTHTLALNWRVSLSEGLLTLMPMESMGSRETSMLVKLWHVPRS